MRPSSRILTLALSPLLALLALAGCGGGSNTVSRAITVTLTPSTSVNVDSGQPVGFMATVGNDVTNSGVTWEVFNTTATSSTPCTLPSCGTLTNITKFSVTYIAPKNIQVVTTITLQATSNANTNITATATIDIQIAPTITTLQLPSGEDGVPYNQTIAASGGVIPLTFTTSSGSLPPGLTLSSAGVISGTPSLSGSYAFTVKVSDAGTPPLTVSQPYTITVSPAPPLSIPAVTLPEGVTGTAYSATISAHGGIPPLTWSASGVLPPGLTLTTNTQNGGTQPPTTGEIAGIPTTPGTYTFTVMVHDSSIPEQFASQTITIIIVNPTPLVITTTSLANGVTAQGYSEPVQASGGVAPLTWSLSGGLLPPGLVLNPTNGVISGTPQRIGTSTFSITVKDSQQPAVTASKTFSITITANSSVTNNELLFSGPYAFFFSGYGGVGTSTEFPEYVIGQLTSNGTGSISSGSEDVHSNSVENDISLTGTYTMGSDGRGQMILTISPTPGVTVIQTFQLAFDAEGNAQFIEADTTGNRGSGILMQQSTTTFAATAFNGNYAFQFAGYQTPPARIALVGEFHADGVGTLSAGTAVVNNAGVVTSYNGVTGQFGGVSGAGRATATLFFTPNNQNYVFYLVNSSEAFFLSTTLTTQQGGVVNTLPSAGIALLQSGEPFSNETLSGSYVVTGTGVNSSQNQSVFGALMNVAPGSGNGSATTSAFIQNDGGAVTTTLPGSLVYGIETTGEVAFTGGTPRLKYGYLVSPSLGLFIGEDSEVTFGRFEQQTPATYSITSIEGQYTLGEVVDLDQHDTNVSGVPASDGAGHVGGHDDFVNSSGTVTLDAAISGTYTVGANGVGTMAPGSGVGLPASLDLFMVSPTQVRLIDSTASDAHPQIYFFYY
jgi:hypothetical protein